MSRKRALIIGNNDYSNKPLAHYIDNANAFAGALRQIKNCQLDIHTNLKSEDMYNKINDFIHSLKPNDFVIFYFSGYASGWDDRNFFLPCDNDKIETGNSMSMYHYGINAQAVVDDMARTNPQVVLFLFDCCRTHSLSKTASLVASNDHQTGILSVMKAPNKTIIGYAYTTVETLSGQSRSMNKGLFTEYLIQHIKGPKRNIVSILENAMNAVTKKTNDTQLFQFSTLTNEVFLVEDVTNNLKEQNQNSNQSYTTNTNSPNRNNKSAVQAGIHNTSDENKNAYTKGQNSTFSLQLGQQGLSVQPDRTNMKNAIIERKAIDTRGELGATYTALCDKVVEINKVKKIGNSTSGKSPICKIFSGDQLADTYDYLAEIQFNDALRQSLYFEMIQPCGVSSLINYNQPVNKNTRFLHYTCTDYIEELDARSINVANLRLNMKHLADATHIITKIKWGIEILCVIQISNDKSHQNVDKLLQNISKQLTNSKDGINLSADEKSQIKELTNVTIYGPKECITDSAMSLDTVLTKLRDWQSHSYYCHPLIYTMHSLRWVFNDEKFMEIIDTSDEMNSSIGKIQRLSKDINNIIRNIKPFLNRSSQNISDTKVYSQWRNLQTHFTTLSKVYDQFFKDCQEIIMKLRLSACETKEIDQIVLNKRNSSLKTDFDTLFKSVKQCLCKMELIERLKKDQIQYKEVSEILPQIQRQKTLQEINDAIQLYVTKTAQSVILWYSSDQLKQQKADEWEKKYQEFQLEKQSKTEETSLIYVDFTQCEQILKDFIIVRPLKENISASKQECPAHQPKSAITNTPTQSSSTPTEINVLLLGETGVGKSTFINAFVNYLIFETLQEAERGEPTVLIPVSFPVTTGDQLNEVTVKFGNVDPNENHESKGQSVTQHCRSYIFDLNSNLRLRLIDTPGIGDTRGFEQDQFSMNHIFTYINRLSHLNAVCLLLKPTVTKIDLSFRSCVRQLSTYLTPNGYGNIIFCFTNSRSTFYGPGNTGSLLKRMLKEEQFENILFEKKNTFCFDDETFRYLAARKCKVKFEDFVQQESINSWTKSVTESIRFIKFIQTLHPYNIIKNKSLRKVALDISMLARPLMEIVRLKVCNWKLAQYKVKDKQMKIQTNSVDIEICSHCAESYVGKFGLIDIVQYKSIKNEKITSCHCPYNEKHFVIEYIVKHEFSPQQMNYTSQQLSDSLKQSLIQCDRLTYFLKQNELINENDPFSFVLERFIDEENQVRENSSSNRNIPIEVDKLLRSVQEIRENNSKRLIESNEKVSLAETYELINELMSIPEIEKQIECIKTTGRLLMNKTEHEVKIPLIKTESFIELINYQP